MPSREHSRVPILVYHKIGVPPKGERHPDTYVTVDSFALQMRFLSMLGYQTVLPSQIWNAKRSGGRLPPKPILLTFDDGCTSVLEHALPELERHRFVATVFMVAEGMGRPAFWDGPLTSERRGLTARELRELIDWGWEIGAHTLSHPKLTEIGIEDAQREIVGSKQALEDVLGREVPWFAYPYGNYNDQLKEQVMNADYKLAFGTETGDGSLYAVPRRIISGRAHFLRFFCRLQQARRLSRT